MILLVMTILLSRLSSSKLVKKNPVLGSLRTRAKQPRELRNIAPIPSMMVLSKPIALTVVGSVQSKKVLLELVSCMIRDFMFAFQRSLHIIFCILSSVWGWRTAFFRRCLSSPRSLHSFNYFFLTALSVHKFLSIYIFIGFDWWKFSSQKYHKK